MAKIIKICHVNSRGDDFGNYNVSLPDPMKKWVVDQVGDGLYSNASDYVRDIIRQDQNAKK